MIGRVPQHLELVDEIAWGLGAADLVCIAGGAAVAWWLAGSFDLVIAMRVGLAAPPLVVGFALGVVRLEGRDLRFWAVLVLRFAIRPRLLLETRRCA